jgi:hypothetical protein
LASAIWKVLINEKLLNKVIKKWTEDLQHHNELYHLPTGLPPGSNIHQTCCTFS